MGTSSKLAYGARWLVLGSIASILMSGCGSGIEDSLPRTRPSVIAEYPHDVQAFTQGLVFAPDGRLFESTGGYGDSTVRELSLDDDGSVVRRAELDDELFGEGLTVYDDELVQLTWQSGRVLRWDPGALTAGNEGRISGEGWGLTTADSPDELVISDGSSRLRFVDGETLEVVRNVDVTRGGEPADQLNELEMVDGVLYANVWKSSDILMIDPASGIVTGVVDASELTEQVGGGREEVLNGIAHRPGDPPGHLFLTGKNWPTIFEVELMDE